MKTLLIDFDGTITKKYLDNGIKVPSIVSILRSENYISDDYTKEAFELQSIYHPKEVDNSLSLEERVKACEEWWTKHFEIKRKYKLNFNNLKQAVNSDPLQIRDSIKDIFIDFYKNNYKIIIVSASGLGVDAIKLFLQKNNIDYPNIKIISNVLKWDADGFMIGWEDPVIHTFNKFDFINREYLSGEVFIIGDNVGDADMLPRDFKYKEGSIYRIGLYDNPDLKDIEFYKKSFDNVLINNDIDKGLRSILIS